MGKRTYTGGCHCGAVRFEVELDLAEGASRCNCAMCTKLSCANVQVKPDQFRLVAGEDSLTLYQRAASPMKYPFCKQCGVHSFGSGDIPELGGEFVTIHVNALDDIDLATLSYRYWDGRHDNWAAGPRDLPWPVRA
jgi:hypothetical protein